MLQTRDLIWTVLLFGHAGKDACIKCINCSPFFFFFLHGCQEGIQLLRPYTHYVGPDAVITAYSLRDAQIFLVHLDNFAVLLSCGKDLFYFMSRAVWISALQPCRSMMQVARIGYITDYHHDVIHIITSDPGTGLGSISLQQLLIVLDVEQQRCARRCSRACLFSFCEKKQTFTHCTLNSAHHKSTQLQGTGSKSVVL